MGRWRRRVRFLGDAFLEVLQAEVESLLAELQSTGRGWLKGLLVCSVAAAFGFWGVGVLTTFAIALLATWVDVWQAAGIVFLLLALATGGLGFIGWRTFRRQRGPTVIVRGHLEDHLGWWRQSLAVEDPAPERGRRGSRGDAGSGEIEGAGSKDVDGEEDP